MRAFCVLAAVLVWPCHDARRDGAYDARRDGAFDESIKQLSIQDTSAKTKTTDDDVELDFATDVLELLEINKNDIALGVKEALGKKMTEDEKKMLFQTCPYDILDDPTKLKKAVKNALKQMNLFDPRRWVTIQNLERVLQKKVDEESDMINIGTVRNTKIGDRMALAKESEFTQVVLDVLKNEADADAGPRIISLLKHNMKDSEHEIHLSDQDFLDKAHAAEVEPAVKETLEKMNLFSLREWLTFESLEEAVNKAEAQLKVKGTHQVQNQSQMARKVQKSSQMAHTAPNQTGTIKEQSNSATVTGNGDHVTSEHDQDLAGMRNTKSQNSAKTVQPMALLLISLFWL